MQTELNINKNHLPYSKLERVIFMVEMLLYLTPAIAALVIVSPAMIMTTFAALIYPFTEPDFNPFDHFVFLMIAYYFGLFSVYIIGRLAISTVRGRQFKFNMTFWFAVAAGVYTGGCLYYFDATAWFLISGLPLIALVIHAAYLQSMIKKNN